MLVGGVFIIGLNIAGINENVLQLMSAAEEGKAAARRRGHSGAQKPVQGALSR